jgi:hypothetical protein
MLQARKVRAFGFISKLVLTTFSSRELSREILRNVFLFVILVERVEEYVVSWLTISRPRNILQHISIFLAYDTKQDCMDCIFLSFSLSVPHVTCCKRFVLVTKRRIFCSSLASLA